MKDTTLCTRLATVPTGIFNYDPPKELPPGHAIHLDFTKFKRKHAILTLYRMANRAHNAATTPTKFYVMYCDVTKTGFIYREE